MNDNIPYRFSRKLFNRYAELIGTAVARYPALVACTPQAAKPAVVAQYIRDSIVGKQRNGWQHQAIDEMRFAEVASHLVVSVRHGSVYIGGYTAPAYNSVSLPTPTITEVTTAKPLRTRVTLNDANRETVLHNLCQLVNSGGIDTEFELHGMDPNLIPTYEMNYAVSFVRDGEAYVIQLQ